MLQIEPAEKFRQFARVCVWGIEKSGKSHLALMMATALAGEDGRVGVISSEYGSTRLLSHRFPHDIIDLTEANRNNGKPVMGAFAPARYEEALKMFVRAGYKAIVIDSLSHAWAGQGGLLEVVGKSSNKFTDGWGEATPAYNHLIDTMLSTRCHIIVTLRAKDDYQMEEYIKRDGTKGQSPKNIGLAPVMRKGFGYEMQLIIRMESMNAHIQASGVEDYIHKGEMIERPGPELAARLLDGLDGIPLPEPTAQQIEMRALLEEVYNLSPSSLARYPDWETLVLRAALGIKTGALPVDYSDEQLDLMRAYIASRKKPKLVKTQASAETTQSEPVVPTTPLAPAEIAEDPVAQTQPVASSSGNGSVAPVQEIAKTPQPVSVAPASVGDAAITTDVPSVADLQARCEKLYGTGKWAVLKMKCLRATIKDDALTPDQCVQLQTAMDTAEARAKQQKQAS